MLPPGLYEATFEAKSKDTGNPDLASGEWVMRCEARTLEDIRALGGNDAADERCFATADRVSQINLALYRTFMQPVVRAFVNEPLAIWLRQLHPLRLQYEAFSDANPLMASVAASAEQVREDRKPVAADNPFLAMQDYASRQIVSALDAWRDANEAIAENVFRMVYGLTALQAAVGVDPTGVQPLRRAPRSALHRQLIEKRIGELKARVAVGGLREAVIRALLFVATGRAAVDERSFGALRRIRETESDISLLAFKTIVREQFFMLLIDTEKALTAIPSMLPADAGARQRAFKLITHVLGASGTLSPKTMSASNGWRSSLASSPSEVRRNNRHPAGLVHLPSRHRRQSVRRVRRGGGHRPGGSSSRVEI